MDISLRESLAILDSVWRTKLFVVAGVKLSLGNVLIALVLLLFAARLSRLMARFINNRLILRFVDDKSTQVTYQTFAFYISLTVVVCLSFTVAGIPLTVFTVVGGALAIGVGFGSQNIVNNFISGIILLIEQPIRVGDTVQVDGMLGTVISINTRSTKIRNGEHKVFIIPNSFFLEKSVLNSTFETSILKGTINFGVAYGSDTKAVERTCMSIMLAHEGIEQDPAPQILFTDFADNNLLFQLNFFSDTRVVSSLAQVMSEVRFQINERFAAQGIDMAFPQRDVNLKVQDSLAVKLLS